LRQPVFQFVDFGVLGFDFLFEFLIKREAIKSCLKSAGNNLNIASP
jgi:hypothetical protein